MKAFIITQEMRSLVNGVYDTLNEKLGSIMESNGLHMEIDVLEQQLGFQLLVFEGDIQIGDFIAAESTIADLIMLGVAFNEVWSPVEAYGFGMEDIERDAVGDNACRIVCDYIRRRRKGLKPERAYPEVPSHSEE